MLIGHIDVFTNNFQEIGRTNLIEYDVEVEPDLNQVIKLQQY